MRLVYQADNIQEAEEIKFLLEDNGIPSFVTEKNTRRIGLMPYIKNSVLIYINKQKNEALTLISNPSYDVQNRVNVTEFYEASRNALSPLEANEYILRLGVKALVVLILIGGLIVYLSVQT